MKKKNSTSFWPINFSWIKKVLNKKLLEECKVAMRNSRRDCLDVFKDAKKNSEISEDDYTVLDKDVQKKLDTYTEKADISCDKKIAEIMEV